MVHGADISQSLLQFSEGCLTGQCSWSIVQHHTDVTFCVSSFSTIHNLAFSSFTLLVGLDVSQQVRSVDPASCVCWSQDLLKQKC